jgi:hypothetical protein
MANWVRLWVRLLAGLHTDDTNDDSSPAPGSPPKTYG